MFNVGTGELMLIMVLALIVLGPDKLPSAARQVGRYLAEFRRISGGFQQEFRNAVDAAMAEAPDDEGVRAERTPSFSLPDADLLDTSRDSAVDLRKSGVLTGLDDDELLRDLDGLDRFDGGGTGPLDDSADQVKGNVQLDGPTSSFN
jgi:Tat protein translocase TatB subunit